MFYPVVKVKNHRVAFLVELEIKHPRDVARNAMKEATAMDIPPPWETESCFTRLLWIDLGPNGRCRFHRPDIWHTINLGIGKAFVASAFSIIQKALPERSIGARFSRLAGDYQAFCKANHHQKYVNRFDEKLFNITGNAEPAGGWNKASVTAIMCRFLEHICNIYRHEIHALGDHRTVYLVPWIQTGLDFMSFLMCSIFLWAHRTWSSLKVLWTKESGARALNKLMHLLYSGDVWLPREVATECVKCIEYFRNTYTFLASVSKNRNEMRFPLAPKLHSLEEIGHAMRVQLHHAWCMNPIVESCSLDEDFVGHAAFITRHVSPRLMAQRTFERYVTQLMMAWRL